MCFRKKLGVIAGNFTSLNKCVEVLFRRQEVKPKATMID